MTRFALTLALSLSASLLLACADGPAQAESAGEAPPMARAHDSGDLPADHPPLDTASTGATLPEGHPPMDGSTAPSGDFATGEVLEAIDAGSYTYLHVKTADGDPWLAGPRLDVDAGETVAWSGATPMKGWHSDRLDRTWDEVLFVESLAKGQPTAGAMAGTAGPLVPGNTELPAGHPPIGATGSPTAPAATVEPVPALDDGMTVEQIHASGKDLAGSAVALRGRVVKANLGILGTNWFHVQDGTGDASRSDHDLTIRSLDPAQVGDIVVVRGQLQADRDFGGGYHYDLIVEDADVLVE